MMNINKKVIEKEKIQEIITEIVTEIEAHIETEKETDDNTIIILIIEIRELIKKEHTLDINLLKILFVIRVYLYYLRT